MHYDPSIGQDVTAATERMRRLAMALLGNAHDAEDVAQESWTRALQGGATPEDGEAWLSGVARNVARRMGRSEGARAARERSRDVETVTPDVAEVAERASLQREVVGDVLALPEPYRSVVLLRWFEDLPPREIARRLERPLHTVKTQLARGQERLRATLQGRHGDERWARARARYKKKRQ